ncbi:MAG: hypothetical protein Ta2F_10180 [Termitinemataceae bacterium]|nr:MAG: hypothetical protein Ta2F_10180 [Termitinemataceae bacterium]
MAEAVNTGTVPANFNTNKRLLGVVVPIGALRGKRKNSIGEYPDLIEFAEFAARAGIGIIQILPVNDTGYESSPYSALSAFALNPIYLRLSDLSSAVPFEKEIAEFDAKYANEKRFPYYKAAKEKMELLHRIFNANYENIKDKPTLNIWIQRNGWVKEYAVFRNIKDANGLKSWREWKKFSKIKPKDIETMWNEAKHKKENIFWCYVQYVCDKQFSAAANKLAEMGIILKGDLPILLNEDSCDVWAHSEYFSENLSAGAPPDFYSPEGQNWGFPIYNWPNQQKDDFVWWKERLKLAQRYFKAYRIDHILGFFRIWATSRSDLSATMGRFVPYSQIKREELYQLGFDDARIMWISQPHIPTSEVWDAVQKKSGGTDNDVYRVFDLALERVNDEELWLFKNHIKNEKDIVKLDIVESGKDYLLRAWKNRILNEYDKGLYSPLWYYEGSRAWNSFNNDEKNQFREFLEMKSIDSEKKWEMQGKKLLSVLVESTSMLACAEDLGAVSACVPRVLQKLKILCLRVVRWFCDYDKPGQPFIPYNEYPEAAVATTSVHDSSTLRTWWESEVNQDAFAAFNGSPSLPKVYNPGTAHLFLKNAAASKARFFIVPFIDLLHLSPKWYADDAASERINIPGTSNEFNWTWRFPASIPELGADTELLNAIKEIEAARK